MKTGIFGGVFNPPHTGHVLPLKYLISNGILDAIEVIPCLRQPLKERHEVPFDIRVKMAKAAYSGIEEIHVNSIEGALPSPSYTINTIDALNLDRKPYLIIGYDQAEDIRKWHKYEELKKTVNFILIKRDKLHHEIDEDYFRKALKPDNPVIEISSTELRKMITEGRDVSEYIPIPVLEIIKQKGLYSERTISS